MLTDPKYPECDREFITWKQEFAKYGQIKRNYGPGEFTDKFIAYKMRTNIWEYCGEIRFKHWNEFIHDGEFEEDNELEEDYESYIVIDDDGLIDCCEPVPNEPDRCRLFDTIEDVLRFVYDNNNNNKEA